MTRKITRVKPRKTVLTRKNGKTPVSKPKTAKTAQKTRNTGKSVPIEDVECFNFVDWLNKYAPDVKYAHIANESRSSKKDAAIRGRKLQRMGQKRGVWDYELFIPIYDVDGEIGTYQEIRIEMKRQRGGGSTTSKEQNDWQKIYDAAGIPTKICFGADEAIKFVKQFAQRIQFDDDEVF